MKKIIYSIGVLVYITYNETHLNSTQLNSPQLKSTQLNSTQLNYQIRSFAHRDSKIPK
jgi:hypothetical protein